MDCIGLDIIVVIAGAAFLPGFALGALVAWDCLNRYRHPEELEDYFDEPAAG